MPIFRYNEQPGNYYAYLIESSGDDLNDGLTPETAVATLDRLVEILDTYAGASRRHAVIVKKRIYNEGITYARNASKPITFEFVGGCELDGSAALFFRANIANDIVRNAFVKDTPYLTYGDRAYVTLINCIIKNSSINYSSWGNFGWTGIISELLNCIIIDSNFIGTFRTVHAFRAENCVIINSSGDGRYAHLKNCILSDGGITGNISAAFMTYNNINSDIRINGVTYTSQAELIAAGYNTNGIHTDPQFTDPTNGQYTVKQSSPCLYRGEGGAHIGIGEGFYLQANILYFQQSAINNFQLTTGRLGFIDPLDNAFIETNPIDIGQIITLESAELAAILPVVAGEFTAGPVSYSHWYPAYSAASTYHKGAGVTDSAILYRSLVDDNLNNTPASSATEWERMTWESGVSYTAGKIVQYTDDKWYKANTATSTSWVTGEWDEVVMIRDWNLQVKTGRTYDECNDADWATIPYNTTPYLDLAGKGNSDDDFDTGTAAIMVFRFIAVRIDAKTIV